MEAERATKVNISSYGLIAFEFIKKVARKEDQVVILTCLIRDQKNRELQIK